MGFETIDVPELPLPGQFSHVVRKGKMVFISGQTADNEGAAGILDPCAHAERVFDYLKKAMQPLTIDFGRWWYRCSVNVR